MRQLIFELAVIAALGASALAAAAMAWQGVSIWTMAFRVPIAGGIVFLFVLVAAHILGRSVLAEMARVEVERRQKEEEEKARQAADSDSDDFEESVFEPVGPASATDHPDAKSGREAA